jgi:O-methyltransferase
MKLLSDQVDEREVNVVLRELERVLSVDVPGDVTEFGCYVGTTSVYLAERLMKTGRTLWLYDSFEGLPLKTTEDQSPAGEQFVTGELLATKKQLIKNLTQAHVPMPKITKGWFNELSEEQVPAQIAFAFLDGDYYHSIKDPLKLIWSRLSPGAIVVVDDYANEALPGAARAVNEWLVGHQAAIKVEHSLAILQLPS